MSQKNMILVIGSVLIIILGVLFIPKDKETSKILKPPKFLINKLPAKIEAYKPFQYSLLITDSESFSCSNKNIKVSEKGVVNWQEPLRGKYDIDFIVKNRFGQDKLNWRVLVFGKAPKIVSPPIKIVNHGKDYSYKLGITGTPKFIYILTTPKGFGIKNNEIQCPANCLKAGEKYKIDIKVQNQEGFDVQSFVVECVKIVKAKPVKKFKKVKYKPKEVVKSKKKEPAKTAKEKETEPAKSAKEKEPKPAKTAEPIKKNQPIKTIKPKITESKSEQIKKGKKVDFKKYIFDTDFSYSKLTSLSNVGRIMLNPDGKGFQLNNLYNGQSGHFIFTWEFIYLLEQTAKATFESEYSNKIWVNESPVIEFTIDSTGNIIINKMNL